MGDDTESRTPQRPPVQLPAGGWPPVTYETLAWQPSITTGRLADIIAGSYSAAVPPMIAAVTPRLDGELLEMSREASFEIARFDSELGAEIGPFASILLRSESASSSHIEHLTASAKTAIKSCLILIAVDASIGVIYNVPYH